MDELIQTAKHKDLIFDVGMIAGHCEVTFDFMKRFPMFCHAPYARAYA
jgi:hypothetical protein